MGDMADATDTPALPPDTHYVLVYWARMIGKGLQGGPDGRDRVAAAGRGDPGDAGRLPDGAGGRGVASGAATGPRRCGRAGGDGVADQGGAAAEFRARLAFNGGLNLRDHPSEVAPNESPDCWNVTIDRSGAVQKRLGYQKWNESGQPDGLVDQRLRQPPPRQAVLADRRQPCTSRPAASGRPSPTTSTTASIDSMWTQTVDADVAMTETGGQLQFVCNGSAGFSYVQSRRQRVRATPRRP